jgi:hypothetical protein
MATCGGRATAGGYATGLNPFNPLRKGTSGVPEVNVIHARSFAPQNSGSKIAKEYPGV